MNIAMISLGCPKNQCDADVLCATLLGAQHVLVPTIEEADVVIVNTCGFIESAKQEAIDHILEACAYKQANKDLKVIVTGCLAQRYGQEVMDEIPECDAVMGIGANTEIADVIARVGMGAKLVSLPDKQRLPIAGERVISTPSHYAYLKIAEGCNNNCHYCAIPLIRGPLRSRNFDETVAEAKWLAEQGVKEIIVVAQDITLYGTDTEGRPLLPDLLQEIEKIDGIKWIRLLYAYPEHITDELIVVMATSHKILPYIDMPIQHINDDVLRKMNRKGNRATILSAIERLRKQVPGIFLRSTVIAGHPGETEKQFEDLYYFIREAKIERLGCFAYSAEEGTISAGMPNQLSEEEKQKRADHIMQLQTGIMAERQATLVGTVQEVICDGFSTDNGMWVCRTKYDAPEIDGVCYVESDDLLKQGEFYLVKIENSDTYDLYGKVIEEETV